MKKATSEPQKKVVASIQGGLRLVPVQPQRQDDVAGAGEDRQEHPGEQAERAGVGADDGARSGPGSRRTGPPDPEDPLEGLVEMRPEL